MDERKESRFQQLTANQLVVAAALADADALRVALGVRLALAAPAAEQVAAGVCMYKILIHSAKHTTSGAPVRGSKTSSSTTFRARGGPLSAF